MGAGIVGFGSHHYTYESEREGDSPGIAFSPGVTSMAIYFSIKFNDKETLLEKCGKHKTGKACVHIKTLADIGNDMLKKMMANHM